MVAMSQSRPNKRPSFSSRSSYAGLGVYKSTDNGKTWEWLGLPESHHIGRIILHPTDKNTAWVAVLGHLYSANKERLSPMLSAAVVVPVPPPVLPPESTSRGW